MMKHSIKSILRLIILGAFFLGIVRSTYAGLGVDPSLAPLSARSLGMGEVSLISGSDAYGIFASPAGLTQFEFPQVITASRKLNLEETQFNLIGWAVPTDWGTFGLGYVSMSMGGSPSTKRDQATQRIIINPSQEAVSFSNQALILSYAQKSNLLSWGGSLKLHTQSLSGGISSQGTATSLDLGINYRLLNWLQVGATLQNFLEGNLNWEGGKTDTLGGYYKLGARVQILGPSQESFLFGKEPLQAEFDLAVPHNIVCGLSSHLGLEYYPQEKIALRTGWGPKGLSLGLGLTNGGFRFDYAYLLGPEATGDNPHYFSLSYVGERVVTSSRKLKRLESALKFLEPKDRSITDRDTIPITAEAKAKKVYDEKTVWTVTAISSTFEVKEVFELEDLKTVYLNGIKIEQTGTIETSASLSLGRNVFRIDGYSSAEVLAGKITPEVFAASAEVKVLRFQPFADTPMNFWAIEPIALNVTLGLVKGYPDNTFKPEKGISRAELVTLLVRTLGASEETLIQSGASQIFKDVTPKHWAVKFVNYGSSLKYVTGYPDGTFKPNKALTRAEGVTILARYAGLTEEVGTKERPFPDLKPEFWANKYIMPAKTAGLLKYLEGKEFKPSEPFTRAEACEVLYRIPAIQKKVNEFWETGIVSGSQ